MKIIVIGSKGFIGSHCFSYFSDIADVWECDVVTDYANSKYFWVDATNADYSDVFQKQNYDVCINCSGAASVPMSLENPQRDFNLNTVNVFKLLMSIKKYNSNCKFINISSAAVYGNAKSLPIKESHTLDPISPYGYHKKIAEDILIEFAIFYDLNTCSLRVFSAYGNRLQKQIFWDLYQKTKYSKHFVLFGTGEESRDYIHINDLVRQIELTIKKAKFNGECINSANGKQIKIREVVDIFTRKINYTGEVVFSKSIREGDPLNWEADISIMHAFGYKQKVTIEEGIERYITWLREKK